MIFYIVSTKFLSYFDIEHSTVILMFGRRKYWFCSTSNRFLQINHFSIGLVLVSWLLRNKSVKSKRNETCLFKASRTLFMNACLYHLSCSRQECSVRWKLAIASTRTAYDNGYFNNMQRIFSETTEKDKSTV